VLRSEVEEIKELSPYLIAVNYYERSHIAEYERLKRSLMSFKIIDWDTVVQPRITESEESSS
jgi:hypothetical protein